MSDYNPTEEGHLLQYNNASKEVLVDVTRYALDGDADKYIEMGYSTYLNLEPVIRIQDGCGDLGSNGCQALHNRNSVLLTIEEWKTLMGLESYLANQFFHDSIEIQHTPSSRLRIIFPFEISIEPPIIEYRLEVIQSRKLKEFYNNLVECVIVQKFKRGEIRRMAAAAVRDVNVVLDENVCESMDVYKIFEQTLNYRCNKNSHNMLCIMEVRHAFCTSLRGPPGLGFKLTPENDYDMENRRLTNVMDPANSNDVLNLKYYLSSRNYFDGSRLLEVDTLSSEMDATNKAYVDSTIRDIETSMRTYMDMFARDSEAAMRTHYTVYFDITNAEMEKNFKKINSVHYAVERDINGIIANIIQSVVETIMLELVVNIQREILTKIPNSIKIAVEESTKERDIIIGDLKAQLYNLNEQIELLDEGREGGDNQKEKDSNPHNSNVRDRGRKAIYGIL
ncbi:hypothetical protein FQA39_LY14950 [Lamprigera yunnana]|nr:hypothetical protein FQA39_LY14950 [Lamprigera yunnana]